MRRTTPEVGVAYVTDLDAATLIILETAGAVAEIETDPPASVWVQDHARAAAAPA